MSKEEKATEGVERDTVITVNYWKIEDSSGTTYIKQTETLIYLVELALGVSII